MYILLIIFVFLERKSQTRSMDSFQQRERQNIFRGMQKTEQNRLVVLKKTERSLLVVTMFSTARKRMEKYRMNLMLRTENHPIQDGYQKTVPNQEFPGRVNN